MTMTDDEIVASYRNAQNRKKQVDILAQFNDCPKQKIVEILCDAGELTGQAIFQYKKSGLLPKEDEPKTETVEPLVIPESVRRFCEVRINDLERDIAMLDNTIGSLTGRLAENREELKQLKTLLGKEEGKSPLGEATPNRQQ